MKKSELQQIIREEISKVLNEGRKVTLKTDIVVYPPQHHDLNQPSKITIPKGKQIEVLEHPFPKQPNDSLIRYKGQKWVVVKSYLDNALQMSKK